MFDHVFEVLHCIGDQNLVSLRGGRSKALCNSRETRNLAAFYVSEQDSLLNPLNAVDLCTRRRMRSPTSRARRYGTIIFFFLIATVLTVYGSLTIMQSIFAGETKMFLETFQCWLK